MTRFFSSLGLHRSALNCWNRLICMHLRFCRGARLLWNIGFAAKPCSALFVERGQYVLANTVFLQPGDCQRQIRQMPLREIASEIGSRLRERTFKKSPSVQVGREKEGAPPCPVVRQGPLNKRGCCSALAKTNRAFGRLRQLSQQLAVLLHSPERADNLCDLSESKKGESVFFWGGDCLPGVFLWPVITASLVTGCSQVVLFASSLLVEENREKGEERTRGGWKKRTTEKMQRRNEQCASADPRLQVIFT